MAHKKGVGSSRNGRDSNPNNLGIKKYGGHKVTKGNILVRQIGHKHRAGNHVNMGKDHTLHALVDGIVSFRKRHKRSYVSILPI